MKHLAVHVIVQNSLTQKRNRLRFLRGYLLIDKRKMMLKSGTITQFKAILASKRSKVPIETFRVFLQPLGLKAQKLANTIRPIYMTYC